MIIRKFCNIFFFKGAESDTQGGALNDLKNSESDLNIIDDASFERRVKKIVRENKIKNEELAKSNAFIQQKTKVRFYNFVFI